MYTSGKNVLKCPCISLEILTILQSLSILLNSVSFLDKVLPILPGMFSL